MLFVCSEERGQKVPIISFLFLLIFHKTKRGKKGKNPYIKVGKNTENFVKRNKTKQQQQIFPEHA